MYHTAPYAQANFSGDGADFTELNIEIIRNTLYKVRWEQRRGNVRAGNVAALSKLYLFDAMCSLIGSITWPRMRRSRSGRAYKGVAKPSFFGGRGGGEWKQSREG